MTEEQKEKYTNFLDKVSEILGLNKPVDVLRLCAVTDEYLKPIEKRIAELKNENAELKELNEALTNENDKMIKSLGCETCQIHIKFAGLNNRITELESENNDLKNKPKAGKDINVSAKWHDLRKDPNDLPIGTVNLDMYPDFIKSRIKPRVKVAAKVGFKGYRNRNYWEEILYYEDGHWLKNHYVMGTGVNSCLKKLPENKVVLAWYEIPQE